MTIGIRNATASEAPKLTEIAFASKRHWGYAEEWIDLWTNELTVDKKYVNENPVFVATIDHRILGWASVSKALGEHWIDYCWVLPDATGRGVGRLLVRRAFDIAAELQAEALKVVADPNAEGFYRRMGFRRIGDCPSLPEGRRLPVMEAYVPAET